MQRKARSWPVLMEILAFAVAACGPFPTPFPPLTAAGAQQTLDQWNPNYCKVVEFYGLHHPGLTETRLAYVMVGNPQDANAKPAVYEARFVLLTRPDGRRQWFLVSLMTQSAGLSRRQGWDNLLVPVREGTGKPAS